MFSGVVGYVSLILLKFSGLSRNKHFHFGTRGVDIPPDGDWTNDQICIKQ